ncbi:MAG: Na(+)-translocating NADH-quinone reductase subunit A [Gammaproteobacteria bacterium]|nr:Na(+)-translocating NADH-quinone reductase subunit A [Gammaproteobacteria bacterium]
MRIDVRKGLSIPLAGEPQQVIDTASNTRSVALLGRDYVGLRPRMKVEIGTRVTLGQSLFEDKQTPGVPFVAPGTGVVTAINRGARRMLQSVVIELEGDAEPEFPSYPRATLSTLGKQSVRDTLIESGLWTALRTRPYSKIPQIDTEPHAIFVSALDTNPLAADPAIVIAEYQQDFLDGLDILSRLTDGKVYVCTAPDPKIAFTDNPHVQQVSVSGPHPAGLVGTHIHFLNPVTADRVVWHLNYQDVIAAGRLFTTGALWTERIVALGGSRVREPRLIRTRLGASTENLLAGELLPGPARVVSGSVLSGHRAFDALNYLGRYHMQISVVPEGQPREFINYMMPGASKFSGIRAFAGHLLHRKPFDLSTSQNGSPRAIVPIGNFEPVMPLDLLPTPLLKALVVRDTDSAQALGCLELDEEDLALCSFVCSGKHEYGTELRACLTQIEKFG